MRAADLLREVRAPVTLPVCSVCLSTRHRFPALAFGAAEEAS